MVSFNKCCFPFVFEKKVNHIISWIWCSISVRSNLLITFSLLWMYWFFLFALWITENGMLKSAPRTLVCSFSFVRFCFVYFAIQHYSIHADLELLCLLVNPLFCHYNMSLFISSDILALKSALSKYIILPVTAFWLGMKVGGGLFCGMFPFFFSLPGSL